MCKKIKGCGRNIDKCIRPLIKFLNSYGFKTVACCCGHGKYTITVIVEYTHNIDSTRTTNYYVELLTNITIERRLRFYKKDKLGHYYIPEIVNEIEGV